MSAGTLPAIGERLFLVRTEDGEGNPVWVEVRREVAEVLAAKEYALKERLLKEPKNLELIAWRDFDELGIRRYSFTLLLGESAVWAGPGSEVVYRLVEGEPIAECRFCGHLERMPGVAYCLGCDRAGVTAKPSEGDLAKREAETRERAAKEAEERAVSEARKGPKNDGLLGGRK